METVDLAQVVGAIAAVIALFGLIPVIQGFLDRRRRGRDELQRLITYLEGQPVLFTPYAWEEPGPTYRAAQSIRSHIDALLQNKNIPHADFQYYIEIRNACIRLKNAFPGAGLNGENLSNSGFLNDAQREVLDMERLTIFTTLQGICKRHRVHLSGKLNPRNYAMNMVLGEPSIR